MFSFQNCLQKILDNGYELRIIKSKSQPNFFQVEIFQNEENLMSVTDYDLEKALLIVHYESFLTN